MKELQLPQPEKTPITPEEIAKKDFGNLWDKLLQESRNSISSAYKTYYAFAQDTQYDFSTVVGPLGKALEGELKIRFYDGYITYLSEKFSNPLNFKSYNKLSNEQFDKRDSLMFIINKNYYFQDYIKHPNFKIGSFRFIIGIDKAGLYNSSKKTFCDLSAIEYVKNILYRDIFQSRTDEETDTFLKELCDNVETLRRYRNEADHPGSNLTIEDANKVLNIMIYTRKILLRILDPLVLLLINE